MVTHLDESSRAAIGRFALKLSVALLLASLSKAGYVLATSAWLSLYAFFTAMVALLNRERFQPTSFNHWDEVLWLVAVSQALRLALRATA